MKRITTKKLVLTSLMAALSLGLYALESLIPPIVPIPGVKLGLANVITLICLYILGAKLTLAVLFVRIALSSLLFGTPMSLLFSISGGLMSFAVMLVIKKHISDDNIWALSVFGAFGHNLGQVAMAVVVTSQLSVAYYFLFLIISSVVTGVFTGICAQTAVRHFKKAFVIKN